MRKKTKMWLIAATSLTLLGCIMAGGSMFMSDWNFSKLSTVKYETHEYVLEQGFENIRIVTNTADVTLLPSSDDNTSVVCYEQKNVNHCVTSDHQTLSIEVVDNRKWYEHIGINFSTPKITVYLSQKAYAALSITSNTGHVTIPGNFTFESIDISEHTGNVSCNASVSGKIKIRTTTGDIQTENLSANHLDLSVSTGNISVSGVTCTENVEIRVSTGSANINNVTCGNLISEGNTGKISFKNVIAAEKFSVQRSTGDVSFVRCDAAEIFITTDTGDVKGSLLSEKVFIIETDTGRINVPWTTSGGKCDIHTDTGDISIELDK